MKLDLITKLKDIKSDSEEMGEYVDSDEVRVEEDGLVVDDQKGKFF